MALLGVGGLGSWAAYALACCGVGELVLVDGDRVEESNFNRQILYRERDIGRLKTEAAAEALAEFNSACRLTSVPRRLEGVAAIREVIDGADFVVNAADWPAHDIERWTNAACVAAGLPFITMSHSPPVARVGPALRPRATGCYACQESAYRESHPLYDELVEQRRGRPSPAPTLGPVCAFVGGQVALEALHQVTGLCPPATLGAAHIYDLRTMRVTREAGAARGGLRGLRRQLKGRDQPRAARRRVRGPAHASGPKHGTWSRSTRSAGGWRSLPRAVPSAGERKFVLTS